MEQNKKNIQKDQELTKEELEQVNGGGFLPRPKGKALWRVNCCWLCNVKTSIKRVKSRMQFELFRAKEVKSKAQSEQTTS